MNCTATRDLARRPLPVRWLDAPTPEALLICRRQPRRVRGVAPRFRPTRMAGPPSLKLRRDKRRRAFTLLEMMMVITIVGIIAGLTLPHVSGFAKAYSMNAATRQLLDDVALARQRAMANRSTVYMVFLPPMFWTNAVFTPTPPGPLGSRQITNLMMHQYSAYALVSLGSVGDQPGRHYARYVTDWRTLPNGVFIAPFEFTLTNTAWTNITTTNALAQMTNLCQVWGWTTATVPFPSLYYPNTNMLLPCIGFTPQGSLTPNNASSQYQYIALARGSIFYPTDTNGNPLYQPPNWAENPVGNDASNPNLIQIDSSTARPTLVQNQFQ